MKYDVFKDNVIGTMHEICNFNKRGTCVFTFIYQSP